VNLLLQGKTEELVLSQFLSGPEFYSRAQVLAGSGAADQRFVQSLCQLLLNRSGTPGETAGGIAALPSVGRQGVAIDFMTGQSGQEFRDDQFEGYYNALLHRPSDPSGLNNASPRDSESFGPRGSGRGRNRGISFGHPSRFGC
jgi:hypothetical protein